MKSDPYRSIIWWSSTKHIQIIWIVIINTLIKHLMAVRSNKNIIHTDGLTTKQQTKSSVMNKEYPGGSIKTKWFFKSAAVV